MRQIQTKILKNEQIAEHVYKMRIESNYLAAHTVPGQFLEVKCSEGLNPLLRRPFSVHRILRSGIEILYETVGSGTEILSCKKPGELLDVIGPLGRGFDIRRMRDEGRRTILVAGGMGVAPLVALAEAVVRRSSFVVRKEEMIVFIGSKTKKQILCEKDFKNLGAKVSITTDDGSGGKKGFVTDLLRYSLRNTKYERRTTIYACGPTAMLKTTAAIAITHHIPCQVSLEERMACGVGVCLGCPVKVVTQYEYKMVCKDGPVFNAEEIAW